MTQLKQSLPNIPRYTSYPTAPNFNCQSAEKAQHLLLRSINEDEKAGVSVYIHIPFCDRLCWFCGCHTKHTLQYEPIRQYIACLIQEIRQFPDKIAFKPKLANLHFGGGSPSMLQPEEAGKLRNVLEEVFDFLSGAEVSIEVDPNDASENMYQTLRILGMTRISLGVQDFNQRVQVAINRPQGFDETRKMIDTFRGLGISSLNVDALYGLPYQTTETIDKTAQQVLSLKPDRIALFGYAHVPSFKKHQRMIDQSALPDDPERLEQSNLARDIYLSGGYEPIGLDHFALESDQLAIAKRKGTIRRNFQGYTTDVAPTLIGFGASSISSNEHAYLQNTVATRSYMRLVEKRKSVAERGIVLSMDDKVRAFIIQSIMCNFRIDSIALRRRFPAYSPQYIDLLAAMAEYDAGELCSFENGVLQLLPDKQQYVRIVASHFDAYLSQQNSVYSKAV